MTKEILSIGSFGMMTPLFDINIKSVAMATIVADTPKKPNQL